MEYKSRIIRVTNIPDDRVIFVERIKPLFLLVLFVIAGVVLIIVDNFLVGFILALVGLYGLVFIANVKNIEIRQSFIILYNQSDEDLCMIIYNDEIKDWRIASKKDGFSSVPYLELTLTDTQVIKQEIFKKRRVRKALKQMRGE